jgi:hypothetical protein
MIACDIFSLFVGFLYAPPNWRLAGENLPQPPSAANHSEVRLPYGSGVFAAKKRVNSIAGANFATGIKT